MMNFVAWFLAQLPDFLLTPPISAFTAFGILFVVSRLVGRMIHL